MTVDGTTSDVVGIVRYRFDRLEVFDKRIRRSMAINAVLLAVLVTVALGFGALTAAVGAVVLVISVTFALLGAVQAYVLVATWRFRRGLPRRGLHDVAIVVRVSGLDVAWPDVGPEHPATFTWADLAQVGVRGPAHRRALRIRAHRRPAGSWWRSAFIPQDLLDTPIEVIARDVAALTGGHVRS
ncbi:hypothetical protein FE697_005280 [Mumia zhuanghuii]|uniref:PH domain-containing protein n=2 Tax=Mumia TaxID=1546255 RepID=A0ABW1QJB4_9ACTN|nr:MULTISPECIES: hypothetical protein [Mumia]KAA1425276.1 hypothetical protein FE697_005280 [Mumia zhuanghuii]